MFDIFSFLKFRSIVFFFFICLQAKARWGAGPRRNNTDAFGEAQEGRRGAKRDVSHMLENQVCRWRRPHLQLLRNPLLRTLRRKGHFTVEQGKRRSMQIKRSERVVRSDWLIQLQASVLTSFFFSHYVRHTGLGIYICRETSQRSWRKKITRIQL